jgi:hypothetical protein
MFSDFQASILILVPCIKFLNYSSTVKFTIGTFNTILDLIFLKSFACFVYGFELAKIQ